MKKDHYHYLISVVDEQDHHPIRMLEIRKKKITIKDIEAFEIKYRYAAFVAATELECDCDE